MPRPIVHTSASLLACAALAACAGEEFALGEGTGGGSSSANCAADLNACPPDEACTVNAKNTGWICLPEGPNQEGEPCQLFYGLADCAHGLFCFKVKGRPEATCARQCLEGDRTAACPGGMLCATLAGAFEPSIQVCAAPTPSP